MRLIPLLICWLLSFALVPAAETFWKAGVGKAVITPETPLWLAGYSGRNHGAEGKLHDLWVKVLVLEDGGGRRCALVTSDMLGFSAPMTDSLYKQFKTRFGLEKPAVMLTSSHTHSGPVLRDSLLDYYPLTEAQLREINGYSDLVEDRIMEATRQAMGSLRPARLGAGEGRCEFAVNRRNNPEKEVARMLEQKEPLKGPVDHSAPVLAVRARDGSLLAAVFGYACHNTTLSGYEWCGDYAGFAQIELEKAHPGMTALFFTGCGADQNPLPRRSVDLCQKYGRMLADGVEAALAREGRELAPKLATEYATVLLNYERNPTREELESAAKLEGVRGRWANRMLRRLGAGQEFEKGRDYAVQGWRLGNQLWLALGGEVVVDYALAYKKQFGETTWVAAYAHDLTAYIPSRRVYGEGGYEAGSLYEYMLPADRWAADAEEKINATVTGLVGRLCGVGR